MHLGFKIPRDTGQPPDPAHMYLLRCRMAQRAAIQAAPPGRPEVPNLGYSTPYLGQIAKTFRNVLMPANMVGIRSRVVLAADAELKHSKHWALTHERRHVGDDEKYDANLKTTPCGEMPFQCPQPGCMAIMVDLVRTGVPK